MEDEIEGNLDLLSDAAGRLHRVALATGVEVDAQNKHLERIGLKVSDFMIRLTSSRLMFLFQSDFVDDQLHMNTERLKRIH